MLFNRAATLPVRSEQGRRPDVANMAESSTIETKLCSIPVVCTVVLFPLTWQRKSKSVLGNVVNGKSTNEVSKTRYQGDGRDDFVWKRPQFEE